MPSNDVSRYRGFGSVAGLPRPRSAGMPIPWITRVAPEGPAWARVDTGRLLRCQVDWLCQVCGEQLPRLARVFMDADGIVLSDAVVHVACVGLALRWCPYLSAREFDVLEVEYSDVHADGVPINTIADYGDEVRTWTVPSPDGDT